MRANTTYNFLNVTIGLLTAIACIFQLTATAQQTGNGKKIYADYHGTRYSREHDGSMGRWSYYKQFTKSESPVKFLCFNADNILENGRHDIAAAHYPLSGLQSDLDPDYIEYQILTAKAAGIDGFFIEWGFPEHESTRLLRAFIKVAAKYKFEIGVNWCDGWLYYDWITKIRPEIKTREDKSKHFYKSFQYLVDSVFAGPTAPIVKGTPVFYLFSGGINADEYQQYVIDRGLKLPTGMKQPVALRRFFTNGKLVNDVYTAPATKTEFDKWIRFGMSPTPWIPNRIHTPAGNNPLWNAVGRMDDIPGYMSSYKAVWDGDSGMQVPIRSGFAAPGFDNRGCAGWGHEVFYQIPRDSGAYFKKMWAYNMASKDKLDMMFIASWSDFTEGHEIQPTVENGYRELRTTLENAALFKNERLSDKGLELPLRLLQLRKRLAFLQDAGKKINKKTFSPDHIALLISNTDYDEAAKQLTLGEEQTTVLENSLVRADYFLSKELLVDKRPQTAATEFGPAPSFISIPDEVQKYMRKGYYEGYITFEYFDEGILNALNIIATAKEKGTTTTIGEIRTANTGTWKKAKVKISKSNWDSSDLFLKGDVLRRNIAISITTFK